jgi:hypothetical protein
MYDMVSFNYNKKRFPPSSNRFAALADDNVSDDDADADNIQYKLTCPDADLLGPSNPEYSGSTSDSSRAVTNVITLNTEKVRKYGSILCKNESKLPRVFSGMKAEHLRTSGNGTTRPRLISHFLSPTGSSTSNSENPIWRSNLSGTVKDVSSILALKPNFPLGQRTSTNNDCLAPGDTNSSTSNISYSGIDSNTTSATDQSIIHENNADDLLNPVSGSSTGPPFIRDGIQMYVHSAHFPAGGSMVITSSSAVPLNITTSFPRLHLTKPTNNNQYSWPSQSDITSPIRSLVPPVQLGILSSDLLSPFHTNFKHSRYKINPVDFTSTNEETA